MNILSWLFSAGDVRDSVQSLFLLVARLLSGGFMLFQHGWGKFERILDGNWKFADPFGAGPEISLLLAVFAEVLCAGLIMIGVWSRAAAIPLIVTMLVAAFIIHADDPIGKQEFPLIYTSVYMLILAFGNGRFALQQPK